MKKTPKQSSYGGPTGAGFLAAGSATRSVETAIQLQKANTQGPDRSAAKTITDTAGRPPPEERETKAGTRSRLRNWRSRMGTTRPRARPGARTDAKPSDPTKNIAKRRAIVICPVLI